MVVSPIAKARELYFRNGKDFDATLLFHMEHGTVHSSSLWFVMLRIIKLDNDQPAFFVECAIGDLANLTQVIALKLPFIAFCREKSKRMRVYPAERLLRLAQTV